MKLFTHLNITILVTIARRFLVTWSLQIKLGTRLLHVKRSRIVTFLYAYTRSKAVFFTIPLIDIFSGESYLKGRYKETEKMFFLNTATFVSHEGTLILSFSEWAQLYANLKGPALISHKK